MRKCAINRRNVGKGNVKLPAITLTVTSNPQDSNVKLPAITLTVTSNPQDSLPLTLRGNIRGGGGGSTKS